MGWEEVGNGVGREGWEVELFRVSKATKNSHKAPTYVQSQGGSYLTMQRVPGPSHPIGVLHKLHFLNGDITGSAKCSPEK